MAAGCPVVAANSGGIPDIVTDGVNGYLFAPQDPNGLVKATQRLLQNPQERLQQNARQEAEKWGWSNSTIQLQKYYDQVIAKSKVPALAGISR